MTRRRNSSPPPGANFDEGLGPGNGFETFAIAVPMIGGMVSSTVLTLIVIPAIYSLVKGANARGWSALRNGTASRRTGI